MMDAHAQPEGVIAPIDRRRSRAALVSVATATTLIVVKLITAIATGSLAVIASLADSALDLVASTTNYWAIRAAERPPDFDHRWGHGKAESLSSLAQASLVGASAATLVWQAVHRLITPTALDNIGVGVVVLFGSSIASLALTVYLRRMSRRLSSLALEADSLHYVSDVLTNGAAAVALLAYKRFGVGWIDPVVSIGIAFILAKSAFDIARTAIDQLMDRELPDELTARVRTAAQSASPDIYGVHELKSRRSGRTVVVELHLEIRASVTFAEAHEITVRAQHAIESTLGGDCLTTIHADPYLAPGQPLDDSCDHAHSHG